MVSPFDAVTQAQLRRIRPRGRWIGSKQGWEFPLGAANPLRQCLGRRFPLTPELKQWLDWCDSPLPPLPLHRELVTAADLDQPLPDGRVPLSHQRSGARWLLARRGAVLADEMGLGKTVQAIATAWFYRDDWPLLIIVPSSVKGSWIDELEKWLPVLQPTDFNIVRSGTDVARLNRRVTLVTYGLLTQSTLAAHIAQAGFKAVIVDESHYIKNRKAKRSKTFAHFICMRERVCVCVLGE